MNTNQATWAKQHDWFFDCQCIGTDDDGFADYEVIVIERSTRPGVGKGSIITTERQLAFCDLKALKAWAGY